MKNKQFAILSVLLVLLLLLTACGTTEKTEYDLLEMTEVSGSSAEEILDTLLDDTAIAELSTEQKERVDLLKSRKTKNEIRERFLDDTTEIIETTYSVGIKDNEICVIYHLHIHDECGQTDDTTDTGCILMSVLVK